MQIIFNYCEWLGESDGIVVIEWWNMKVLELEHKI